MSSEIRSNRHCVYFVTDEGLILEGAELPMMPFKKKKMLACICIINIIFKHRSLCRNLFKAFAHFAMDALVQTR